MYLCPHDHFGFQLGDGQRDNKEMAGAMELRRKAGIVASNLTTHGHHASEERARTLQEAHGATQLGLIRDLAAELPGVGVRGYSRGAHPRYPP